MVNRSWRLLGCNAGGDPRGHFAPQARLRASSCDHILRITRLSRLVKARVLYSTGAHCDMTAPAPRAPVLLCKTETESQPWLRRGLGGGVKKPAQRKRPLCPWLNEQTQPEAFSILRFDFLI